MMLQGHFIDTLLLSEYKDDSYLAFSLWSYFRGITAPTFFTISGLIFTYLLLRAKDKNEDWERIRKGVIRGLMLIGIGYLLRFPIFDWLNGRFNINVLKVDVLHIIGLSLIIIIALYLITFKHLRLFSMVTLALGCCIFVTEPLYRGIELENLPIFFSNYLSKSHGSIFTILPWLGYICFGGYLASVFYRFLEKPRFKPVIIIIFFLLGYVLIEWSSFLLVKLHHLSGIQLFYDAANFNYLFTRLGNVLIYFGLFYGLENFIKFPLFLKIGQKTLSIYVIHFIIMYGSFTGYGLSTIIGRILYPWQAIIGAIIFLIGVCVISFNYVKTNAFIYAKFRLLIDYVKEKKTSN
jgi:hypothetical protein